MSYWKLKLTIIGAANRELFIWMFQKKDIDSDIRYEKGINIRDAHMAPLSNSKWSVQSQIGNITPYNKPDYWKL